MIKATVSKGTSNGMVSLDPWSKAFSATSYCHTEKEVARLKGTGHITLKKGSEVTRCYPVRETEAPPVGPMDFIMPHHASRRSPGLQTEPSLLMWKRNQSSSMGITPSIEIPSLFMKEVSDKCLPSQVELSSCSSKSVKQDLCHPGLHGKHQKKRSQHHVYLPLTAGSGNSITVRQAESKQFSKNMDQLRPLKTSFYGVNVQGVSPWAVLCILSQSLFPQQHWASKIYDSFSLPRDPSLQKTYRKERVRF